MRPFLALLLIGCATTGQATSTQPERAILTTPNGVLRASPVEQAPTDSVPSSPETVMRALIRAYEGMGIPVTLVDPAKRRLGNPGFLARRALNGIPLHEYMNCGDKFTGLRADDDRITITIISVVRPTPKGSEMETRLEASATDVAAGNSVDNLPCSSSGKLETLIHQQAKLKLVP